MRRIVNTLLVVLFTFIVLFIFEKMIGADGLAIGMFSLFWTVFKSFFAEDEIINIILFIIFAVCIFGTFSLSRRQENKVWSIATAIGGIISLILMFVK